ncbi:hypothetical protein KDK82_1776 [Delftia sp. K82]|uniref:hypothetical protein n=1 Tax=Delftia sp. K82 TaxID=1472718 RepID=UPI000B490AFB|nr:hypothetical protein [Delftia sp. K82]OWG18297.1 hypothetical protein KDK82_1776 [Delftia sp. K82]
MAEAEYDGLQWLNADYEVRRVWFATVREMLPVAMRQGHVGATEAAQLAMAVADLVTDQFIHRFPTTPQINPGVP